MRTCALDTRSRQTVSSSSDRLVAMAVAVMIWAASADASGASPPPSEPVGEQDDVGELFRSGQDRFETSDFEGAIEKWTRAYEQLPDAPEHQAIRAMLLANLAQAHVEAYAIGEDPEHLRRADALFVSYLAMVDEGDRQTHEAIEAERRRIAELLAEVEEQQREAERAAVPEPERGAIEPAGAGRERPKLDPQQDDGSPSVGRRSPGVEPFNKWERALVIGGGVTLAFGVGLTGASAAFLWLRNEEERRGKAAARDIDIELAVLRDHARGAVRFNRLAISTGAASGVLVAIGLGLVGTADVHRRRRADARPTVGLGPGTLVVRGRF